MAYNNMPREERARRNREMAAEMVEQACKDCGETFLQSKVAWSHRCPDCQRIHRLAMQRAWRLRKGIGLKRPPGQALSEQERKAKALREIDDAWG